MIYYKQAKENITKNKILKLKNFLSRIKEDPLVSPYLNKNKNWKESLLKFLDKQNKNGIDWCKELYDLIKRKKFQNENKFIDLFFWSKYKKNHKQKEP